MKKEEGMKSIQKIGVLSVAYVLGIFYALLGLLQGITMAVQVNSPTLSAGLDPLVIEALSGLGWWLALIMPLMFAIIGFLGGVVFAVLYNLIVKFTGGIRVKLE